MAGGRPTIYSQEILTKTQSYIDQCEDKAEPIISGESEKFTAYKEKLRVNLPTIEGLSYHLNIHKDTIYEWENIYPEFSDLINILRGKQAKELINKGLSGDYNPIIAKLLLMKHGYKDSSEVDQNVSGSLNVSFKDAE